MILYDVVSNHTKLYNMLININNFNFIKYDKGDLIKVMPYLVELSNL